MIGILEDAADYKAFEKSNKIRLFAANCGREPIGQPTGLPAVAASPRCNHRERVIEYTGWNDLQSEHAP